MKIEVSDIDFTIHGFTVEKIKKMSNKKLMLLDEMLSESVESVLWVNMDDMKFLTVSWIALNGCFKKREQEEVCRILNEVIK